MPRATSEATISVAPRAMWRRPLADLLIRGCVDPFACDAFFLTGAAAFGFGNNLFQFRPVELRAMAYDRAPAVDPDRGLAPSSQLQLGLPTAPETNYLPLLPSGPDGVRSASPRRAKLSTLPADGSPRSARTSGGNSTPL